MTSKPKYRIGLEENFANKAPMFDFEPYKVPYTVERKYIPDFVYKTEAGHDVLIECKGYFRVGDTQKYKAIKRCLVFDELIFLLSDPKKRLRKGAKMNMGQWCDKEGIPWYTLDTVDKLLEYVGADA